MAQDRDQWRALVKALMSFVFRRTLGISLLPGQNYGFSKELDSMEQAPKYKEVNIIL